MKTTETKQQLNIVYLGTNPTILKTLFEISGFKTKIIHYENQIHAHHDLDSQNIKCDILICDSKLLGINLHIFFENLKKIKMIKYLVDDSQISATKRVKLTSLEINDVISSNLNHEELETRLNYLFIAKNQKSEEEFVYKSSLLKRAFDIIFSSIALIILSPVLILTIIAIKLDSKGSIFFISKRVGTGFKIFNFYKFRTMKTGAQDMLDQLKDLNQYTKHNESEELESCEKCRTAGKPCSEILIIDQKEICENFYLQKQRNEASSFLKFKNDPRVTKLGHFLRRTSIDELPQLFNILKGDMSFVGNRPLPIYEAEQLTSDQWGLRFLSPSGLTGLWQVRKRGQSEMSEMERKMLDNSYALNRSFLKDIKLIIQTFPALTQKENV